MSKTVYQALLAKMASTVPNELHMSESGFRRMTFFNSHLASKSGLLWLTPRPTTRISVTAGIESAGRNSGRLVMLKNITYFLKKCKETTPLPSSYRWQVICNPLNASQICQIIPTDINQCPPSSPPANVQTSCILLQYKLIYWQSVLAR